MEDCKRKISRRERRHRCDDSGACANKLKNLLLGRSTGLKDKPLLTVFLLVLGLGIERRRDVARSVWGGSASGALFE